MPSLVLKAMSPVTSSPVMPQLRTASRLHSLMCRDQGEVASQTEDRLLEVLKAVGARVDSAVGTFTNLSSFGRTEQSEVGKHNTHPLLLGMRSSPELAGSCCSSGHCPISPPHSMYILAGMIRVSEVADYAWTQEGRLQTVLDDCRRRSR